MRRAPLRRGSRQRGIALLVVLWACTLLAILLGGYAMLARTEGMQARYQFAQTQAHYAAEAGVMRAIYGLQDPVARQRWVADGRIYPFHYAGATISVSAIDEGGKVDLNSASPQVLQGLFKAAGLHDDAARQLAAAVAEWRSYLPTGDAPGPAVSPAGAMPPRHAPFASIEEVQQVAGMTPALYRMIAPQLTIWSGRDSPDPASAPPLALAAIPGMTPERASEIAAARLNGRTDSGLARSVGVTHSIRSEATLADGTRAVLRATIRLQGIRSGAQPYAVLRWQEGDGE
ncbi:general secretion pathway protein GspK [Frateuria sp. Soil773]|uniref:general secretion pathway protein GspK n=1 Tax=Frateuria sp. Soil773 TaxID=1736407 RepID=UPI0006FECCDA|nr:type II secretion system protein GspK [Frateuria sp. Soil773]KRE94889.1 general secretion pathway protein GspK [Frateuria sp. Soil773]